MKELSYRIYNVYDIVLQKYIAQEISRATVAELIGIYGNNVGVYADRGFIYAGRYKIENADLVPDELLDELVEVLRIVNSQRKIRFVPKKGR